VAQCPKCKVSYPGDVKRCPTDGTILSVTGAVSKIGSMDRTTPAPMDRTTPAPRTSTSPSQAALQAIDPKSLRDAELENGTVVGEYQITGKLGAGGMGTVYSGVHPVIGKKVAIKVLNGALSEDAGMVTRFVQEARAVNQIGHRNIVDIFAFGQLQSGRSYFVMELLSGKSLKARLDGAAMPYGEAFGILLDVCDALTAAHAEGIVHRDLKPDNIHLAESKSGDKTVKLLDFGIAKLLRADEGLASTRTGVPMGTPLYMSPEQCLGRNVDARTDLYSLGVIMFEIFTGHLPFAGPSYIETVNGHLQSPPPRPSTLADVPPPLEELILRCLEKDPGKRPQNTVELRAELMRVATALGAELPRKLSGVHVPVGARSTPLPKLASQPAMPTQRGGNPALIYALIALVAAGLVVGGVLFLRPKKTDAVVEPAAAPAAAELALQIITDVPGADVTVNGKKEALKTPMTFRLPWTASIALKIEKADYAPYTDTIKLQPGETERSVSVALKPLKAPMGRLEVRAVGVKKASWLLDGKPAGDGSAALMMSLTAGKHMLKVEASGFAPREESITIEPQSTRSLEWVLPPASHGSHHGGKPAASPGARPESPSKPAADEPGAEWPPR
jgi:serine/threonine-protein kinase